MLKLRLRLVVLILPALVLGLTGVALAQGSSADQAPVKFSRQDFHDDMRKLWEDHITWTRLAIVSFAGDLDDLTPTLDRLLQNQSDIGDAIKPFYGDAAGEALTDLLEEHILGAVAILQAASGGGGDLQDALDAWYDNGNEIADFLNAANPAFWPQDEMRLMMKEHLDLTLAEATARLGGDFNADIAAYEEIHEQILEMADMLSSGIMSQFPRNFRS